MDEWLEQVRDIETTMAESENGKLPDALVIKMIKSFLASNICLNQGYVLDGYPKTIAQVKKISTQLFFFRLLACLLFGYGSYSNFNIACSNLVVP